MGLSLWFTDDAGAPTSTPSDTVPAAVATLIDGRTLRRTISVVVAGSTVRAGTITLGPAATVELLDSPTLGSAPGGELTFYRHVTQSVRRFLTSGAVAPSVAWSGGAWTVRWTPVPTARWRTWLSQTSAAAPAVITDNGGAEAVEDFCHEIVDLTCRERCRPVPEGALRSPFVRSLLPDVGGGVDVDRAAGAARAWDDWTAAVREGESSLVLRLHEPTAPTDPDLVEMDAERWRLQVCRRTPDGDEPVEIRRLSPLELDEVTTELAAAVRVFEPLTRADHDDHTLDFLVDTETVGALLDHGATALGDAGVGVLLPRTIAVATPSLSLRGAAPGATVQRSVMAGLAEIRDFQWQLALGDTVLDEGELRSLAEQKGGLVRVRGVWVSADSTALRRAAEFITTQQALAAAGHPPDMGELFGLVTGAGGPGLPVTSVSGLSWLDDIADQGGVRPTPLQPPETLDAVLRPYQHRGLEWLAHLSELGIGAVLADDMGLGKTVQIIALLCAEREAYDDPGPTLIVCPMSVVGNWEREIARFAPHLRVLVHHGPGRTRASRFAAAVAASDVVVTTFALTVRDKESLGAIRWDRVVVDEAQHVKNVSTAAARAVRAVPARHRIALTGTPVENRLEDLRAVVDLVNPGLLGSPSVFKARFAEAIERERDPDAVRRLSAVTSPFILRRVKSDPTIVADLPAKTEFTVRANLTVEQAALYRAVTDDLMAALGKVESDATHEGHRVRTVLAALTRLKQVCNHPAHFLGDGSPLLRRNAHRSGKLELLADIVDTIVADGERALLFTQFTAFGEMLAPWLATRVGAPVPFLHGGVGRSARDAMVEQFSAPDGPPLMIASLKAGGTGLNLTAANHVLHVDRWWNPAVEDQATDRAHRIGQTREVEVRTFVCIGTIEERIDAMIRDKRVLSDLTVTSGEHWLADIGDDELHDLIRLRDEAVGE
ncbi:Helicase conserved C-terminal domain-containing protein [Williamsia deligens]|nr:Helicase conserved C-terminal domain-containing protein [Williamsia deligens]